MLRWIMVGLLFSASLFAQSMINPDWTQTIPGSNCLYTDLGKIQWNPGIQAVTVWVKIYDPPKHQVQIMQWGFRKNGTESCVLQRFVYTTDNMVTPIISEHTPTDSLEWTPLSPKSMGSQVLKLCNDFLAFKKARGL